MSESSNVNEPCHFLKTFYRNKATILKFLKFIFLLDPISAPLLHCYLQISIVHFNYIYIYIFWLLWRSQVVCIVTCYDWWNTLSTCFCTLACNNFGILLELEMEWLPIGESDIEARQSSTFKIKKVKIL